MRHFFFTAALVFFWLAFIPPPSPMTLPPWFFALGKACLIVAGLGWWEMWRADDPSA